MRIQAGSCARVLREKREEQGAAHYNPVSGRMAKKRGSAAALEECKMVGSSQ